MSLVKQRIKWEYEYHFGKEPWFPAFLDYKKNKDSESFRLNASIRRVFRIRYFIRGEVEMSSNDKWFFGFITLWIVLTAGTPDVVDAATVRLMGSQCTYDVYKGVKP